MTPVFSLVIPTHNRYPVLESVLDSLGRLTDAPPFEVILVDDGSTDETPREIPKRAFPFPFSYHVLPQGGPAKARNFGLRAAKGEVVAFFGDDTVLDPLCLFHHGQAHRDSGHPTAVLGFVRWAPRMKVTRFMRYIAAYGLQFGYAIIPDPEDVPFNFFYTSNISLPRSLMLEAGGFDETFPYAAWEDIELAYRLQKKHGMKMIYRPKAVVSHHHPTTIASFLVRQNRSGLAAAVFLHKHPELEGFLGVPLARNIPAGEPRPLRWKRRIAQTMEPTPFPVPCVWYREIMEHRYLQGLGEGLRGMPGEGYSTERRP